ncbi:MAG: zf-HC2 domain-containing protein [Planctomycetia bacterium]|nr:zf-HC2 domain-containing protein [Planctomycetia bacterium]
MRHDQQQFASAAAWSECPKGTLQQLSRRLHVAKVNRTIRRVSTVLTVSIVIVAGARSVMPSFHEAPPRGLTCAEVTLLLPRLIAGHLPASTANEMAIHLQSCPSCAATMREMQEVSAIDAHLRESLVKAFTLDMLALR